MRNLFKVLKNIPKTVLAFAVCRRETYRRWRLQFVAPVHVVSSWHLPRPSQLRLSCSARWGPNLSSSILRAFQETNPQTQPFHSLLTTHITYRALHPVFTPSVPLSYLAAQFFDLAGLGSPAHLWGPGLVSWSCRGWSGIATTVQQPKKNKQDHTMTHWPGKRTKTSQHPNSESPYSAPSRMMSKWAMPSSSSAT